MKNRKDDIAIQESLEAATVGVAFRVGAGLLSFLSLSRSTTGKKGTILARTARQEYVYPVIASSDIDRDTLLQIRAMMESIYSRAVLNVVDKAVYNGQMYNSDSIMRDIKGNSAEAETHRAFTLMSQLHEDLGLMESKVSIYDEMKTKLDEKYNEDVYMESSLYARSESPVLEASLDKGALRVEGTLIDTKIKVVNSGGDIKEVSVNLVVKCPMYTRSYDDMLTVFGKNVNRKEMSLKDRWFKFKKDSEFKFISGFLLDIKSIKDKVKSKQDSKKLGVIIDKLNKGTLPYITYVISEDMFEEFKAKNNIKNEVDVFKTMKHIAALSLIVVGYNNIKLYSDGATIPEVLLLPEISSETDHINAELKDTIKRMKVRY